MGGGANERGSRAADFSQTRNFLEVAESTPHNFHRRTELPIIKKLALNRLTLLQATNSPTLPV